MKASSFTPRRLQIALIGLPMLIGAIYYAVFAAPRYVSQSIVAVNAAAVAPLSTGFSVTGGLIALQDTLYLIDYVHSDAVLRELDGKLKLREHYEQPKMDFIFKAWGFFTHERFLDYFRDRVELEFNDLSGLLTIRTQGFDAKTANAVNRSLLESSERFVNEFSQRVAREQMAFSQSEAASAASRLASAKAQVVKFQNSNRILDPVAQTAAAGALTAELQATIARLEADLKNKLSFMQADAPAVQAVRDQIVANRAQLDIERARTTSSEVGDRLGSLNVEYQRLQLESVFAEDAYRSAQAALDTARVDAAKKLKSLVIVEPPSAPESAEYPRYTYNLLTLLAMCVIVYAVVRLIVATIQEHQD